ncbi:hypothetical protein H8S37_02555 [Mediterraneibacter sp. NSJ-55]|uniref:Uncharacterized protein n=1 Tax=Mediterraneibacter hominis TaxID=2763054 RepID=A0A923LGY2_9FIRM|nr:hypothetical protein [Mediterraneibacter hominis]MBC5687819.1 hypothetical protein [Mediterraneibacter hominis]
MKWALLLFIIIVIKVILGKGLMLGLILLTVWGKGVSIKKNPVEWDKFFMSINEVFLNSYIIVLYCISTVLSSCVAYLLFHVFGFQYPLFKTSILAIICMGISGMRYNKKGKQVIKEKLNKVKKSVIKEEIENI